MGRRSILKALLASLLLISACGGEGSTIESRSPDIGPIVSRDTGSGAEPADPSDTGVDTAVSQDTSTERPADTREAPTDSASTPPGQPDGGPGVDSGAPAPDTGPPVRTDTEGASQPDTASAGNPMVPVEGFGRRARGGLVAGARQVMVTSKADSGPGSLREALRQARGPTRVRFAFDGTITLNSYLDVPSEVAIDGRGRQVTLTGCGLRLNGVRDVVILNVAFRKVGRANCGDAIQIRSQTENVAISHCSFDNSGMKFKEDVPDELISVVFGSTDITIQWSKFRVHEKVMLFGNGDAPASLDAKIRVTLHHNFFDETGRRHPFLRHGKVDMYNNFLRDWKNYREIGYGVRVQDGGELLVESNWFKDSFAVGAYPFSSGGALKLVGNKREGTITGLSESNPGKVFKRPYPATIDPLDSAFKRTLKQKTGNVLPAP